MTVLLYVIVLLIFLLVTSGFLFQKGIIESLSQSAWKAFAVTALSVIMIAILVQKPISNYVMQMGVVAVFLGVLQSVQRFVSFLPLPILRITNLVRAGLSDFFALITFFILFRSRCSKQTPKKLMGEKTPILMIHGYGHDAGAWIHHGPSLKKAGFGPLYTIDLGSVEQSIVDYSKIVSEKVKMIAQEMRNPGIFLIGYSMGGLVAAYYAFHLAPENSVRGIITLGTPLAGTKIAELGCGDCAQEMQYRSPFVNELREKMKSNTRIPFWHIGSWSETIVRPPTSAWLEGSYSQNIAFEDIGHLSMLYSDRITKCLCHILEKDQSLHSLNGLYPENV